MIFELVKDFAAVLDAMPKEHPRRRILKLLEEAIRRDVHFIDRHPTTFFQCMWNSCWWYDCPEAAKHYEEPESGWKEPPPWDEEGTKLSESLESWHRGKQQCIPNFRWLRSLRPPALRLDNLLFFSANTKNPFALCWLPNNQLLATTGDSMVHLWNVETCESSATRTELIQGIRDLECSPDGTNLLACTEHGDVIILDALNGTRLNSMRGHNSRTRAKYTTDGEHIVTYSDNAAARKWDASTGTAQCDFTHPSYQRNTTNPLGPVQDEKGRSLQIKLYGQCFTVSDNGKYVALPMNDRISCRHLSTGSEVSSIYMEGSVSCLAFSKNGEWIAAGGRADVPVKVWEVASGAEIASFKPQAPENSPIHSSINSIAFSPDGSCIVTGGDTLEPTVRFWDVKTQSERACLTWHTKAIERIAFTSNGDRVASCSLDGSIAAWRLDGQIRQFALPREVRTDISCIALSPSGKRFAYGTYDGDIVVANTADGDDRLTLQNDWPVISICFSPRGTRLTARGGTADQVVVWDILRERKRYRKYDSRNYKKLEKAKAQEFPKVYARVNHKFNETTINVSPSDISLAFFAGTLTEVTHHAVGYFWMGLSGTHINAVVLEGGDDARLARSWIKDYLNRRWSHLVQTLLKLSERTDSWKQERCSKTSPQEYSSKASRQILQELIDEDHEIQKISPSAGRLGEKASKHAGLALKAGQLADLAEENGDHTTASSAISIMQRNGREYTPRDFVEVKRHREAAEADSARLRSRGSVEEKQNAERRLAVLLQKEHKIRCDAINQEYRLKIKIHNTQSVLRKICVYFVGNIKKLAVLIIFWKKDIGDKNR